MKRLRAILCERRIRNIDLAEWSGVPDYKISRCLRHPIFYKFTQEEKVRISEALGMSVDELFPAEEQLSERLTPSI